MKSPDQQGFSKDDVSMPLEQLWATLMLPWDL